MGVGAALATGLIQGFTQNIGVEAQKRVGERDRINKLTDAILVSSVGENFNNANVEAIQKMISGAEEQMQARGGIDPFGTRSDDILTDSDLTGLLGSLKSTAEAEDLYTLGGFKLDNEIKRDYDGSYELLNNWTRIMSDPANVDLLATRTSAQLAEINAAVTTARRVISAKEVDTQTPGAVKTPNLYGVGENAMFPGIENWDNFAKGAFPNTPDVRGVSGWKVPDFDAIEPILTEQGVEFASVGTGTENDDGTTTFQYIDLTGMPEMQRAHDELAAALGLQGEESKALLNYWQTSFMNVPGDPRTLPQYTANALEGALEFGLKMANPSQIKVSDIRTSIAGDGAFATLMYNSLNAATIKNGSDLRSKVYALAAHLPAPTQVKPATMIGDMVTIEPTTVQMYILGKVFGPDKDKIKFKDFLDNQKELEGAVTDLNALKDEFLGFVEKIENEGGELTVETANMAYEAFKRQVKFVVDPNQGVLGGVLKDVTAVFRSDNITDERMFQNDQALTTEYRDHLENLVKSKSGPMAQLEAMRISLAFRMARAADPSGRLSNQDIEIQLRKLGSNFTSISDAVNAIEVSIDEFTRKQQQYAIFAQYAGDDYVATPEDLKVVEAAIMIDELERGVSALNKPGSTVAGDDTGAGTPPDISNVYRSGPSGGPYKYIDQSTGATITDQKIIDAYEAAQGSI